MFENKSMILFAAAWMLCAFLVFPAHAMGNQPLVPSPKTSVISPVPDNHESTLQRFPSPIAAGEQVTVGVWEPGQVSAGMFSSFNMNFSENAARQFNQFLPGAVK